jgi:hypothetical protein
MMRTMDSGAPRMDGATMPACSGDIKHSASFSLPFSPVDHEFTILDSIMKVQSVLVLYFCPKTCSQCCAFSFELDSKIIHTQGK